MSSVQIPDWVCCQVILQDEVFAQEVEIFMQLKLHIVSKNSLV